MDRRTSNGAWRVGPFLVVLLVLALSSTASGATSLTKSWPGLRAVGHLEKESLDRWPGSFAGLWLGERGNVFIAFTERASRRTNRVGSDFPKPGRLRPVVFDDSLASLRQLQAQMIADRESNPPVRLGFEQAGAPRPPGPQPPGPQQDPPPDPQPQQDYDLDIDIKQNVAVAIFEEPVTPELSAAFAERYGEDVEVRQGLLAEPEACVSGSSCTPDLRAGLDVWAESGTGCTTAFNSQIFDGDLVLSAAHCGEPDADVGDDRFHGGVRYGSVVAEQQSGRVDAELHVVDAPGFNAFHGLIYASDLNKSAKVFKVGTYAGMPIGLPVCKSGMTTGKSCGEILSKTYSSGAIADGGMDFIKASYCGEQGDSGSPVYASSGGQAKIALGVHSAGPATLCGDPADYGVFGHVEFIEDAFTITITPGPPLADPGPGD